MKKVILSLALVCTSMVSQASIVCKINNSSQSLEFSKGTPYVIPGGLFRKPQVYTPIVIMKLDGLAATRSVYSNGCHSEAALERDDSTATIFNFCLEFVIYRGAGYCQGATCPAKLDMGWVANDAAGNNVVDAQCTGSL